MKTVYNEWYGEIPVALNRAIKKYNVSPSDFQDMEHWGFSPEDMVEVIKNYSPNGYFQVYLMHSDMRDIQMGTLW